MTDLYDLPDIMARLPMLQKRALSTIDVSCDAVDYWPYAQEGFPYLWNRIESMTVDTDTLATEDMELHIYTVTMALVIAHLTADAFRGENSHNAYRYIPAVLDYFRQEQPRHLFDERDEVYRTEPRGLWPFGSASITGIPNGTRALSNSGTNTQQIALVFSIDIPLMFDVY